MSINTAFTALADAIREKASVSGKLSITAMTEAVNGIVINTGGDINFDGVTVTADKLLDGVVAIDKNGNKITGNIKNGAVSRNGAEVTVSAGYYSEDLTIEYPTLLEENITIVGSDVKIPAGYYTEETSFALPSAEITVNENTVNIESGYVAEFSSVVIPESTITETSSSVTITPGYVAEKLSYNLGSGGVAVEYGYINADGNIQKLDLSGDAPVDVDAPVNMDIVLFATGQAEPAYSGGDIPEPPVVPDIPSDYVFYASLKQNTEQSESGQDLDYEGYFSYGSVDGVPCAEFNGSNYIVTDDSALPSGASSRTISVWVRRGGGDDSTDTTIVSYGVAFDNKRFALGFCNNYFEVWGASNTTTYSEFQFSRDRWYHIVLTLNSNAAEKLYVDSALVATKAHENLNTTLSELVIGALSGNKADPFTGKIAALRIYDRVLTEAEISELSKEFTQGSNSVSGAFNLAKVTEYTDTTLKGVMAVGYTNGVWKFASTETTFAGFEKEPAVSGIYATDGIKLLGYPVTYLNVTVSPFNVDAVSYTGSAGGAVTWTYADGSIAYCSRYRNDWSVDTQGVFALPPDGVITSDHRIAGDNGDNNWYFAWTNQTPVVVKGFQFVPGFEGQYGTVGFKLQGSDSNTSDLSAWTTIAEYSVDKNTYDKLNYFPVANNTAYKWYRIYVTYMNTLPYIAYLSVFSQNIKQVYE